MTNLSQIFVHTPGWVFALFVLLLVIGLRQLRERQVSVARFVSVPLVMAAYSFYGVISGFGLQPSLLAAWGAAVWLVIFLMLRTRTVRAVRYDATTGMVRVPGSAVPLALFLAIFALKYIVTVALIMRPALRQELPWMVGCAALYGTFTGLFVGRAARLGLSLLRTRRAAHASL